MKQYVVDELRLDDYQKLKKYLEESFDPGAIDGIYWVPLEDTLLTRAQAEHMECHPLCFAIELESDKLSCELLIRTRNRIRCSCIDYATEKQRNWIVRFVDTIFERLDIFEDFVFAKPSTAELLHHNIAVSDHYSHHVGICQVIGHNLLLILPAVYIVPRIDDLDIPEIIHEIRIDPSIFAGDCFIAFICCLTAYRQGTV